MHGTLDTFGVVEMLQMLARTKLSGTLHIECPRRLLDVRFVHGRIAETRDSTRVMSASVIGTQLVERGLVTEAQLLQALAQQEVRPRPLGTILVEHNAIPEAQLRVVLSRQVANTLIAARVETDGEFLFLTDHDTPKADFITIDTQSVLLDISSLGEEFCTAIDMIGQDGTVLVQNAYDLSGPHRVPANRDEAWVLAQVDGQRTVREIVAASRLEEMRVVSMLGRMVESGLLLVKMGLKASEEPLPTLQSRRDTVWSEVSRLLEG